jgi:hypothetical protein
MIVNDKEDNDDDEEQEEDWAGNDAYQLHRAPHGRVLRLLEVTWVKWERRIRNTRVKTREHYGLTHPQHYLHMKNTPSPSVSNSLISLVLQGWPICLDALKHLLS